MADFNENQNGVFGGVNFSGENNGTLDGTTFFEGTAQNAGNNVFSEWQTTPNINSNNGEIAQNAENTVYGAWEKQTAGASNGNVNTSYQPVQKDKAITKQGLWTKIKAFLFQEIDLTAPIKVELTPYQQKVEDEINEFLHQEISFKGIAKLFKK